MASMSAAKRQAPDGAANAAPKAEADTGPAATPDTRLGRMIEAALMASDRPVNTSRLSELLGKAASRDIQKAIEQLNQAYERQDRSFRIESVAGGWQLLTLPEFADMLKAMHRSRQQSRMSPAALETLAIVAYKQPIVRAEIEAVRGVASGEVLRSLMERHLIKIVGRAEELGRPMLYGTTQAFLEVFGLASLKDLPKTDDLKAKSAP